jgi:hypothetical protein
VSLDDIPSAPTTDSEDNKETEEVDDQYGNLTRKGNPSSKSYKKDKLKPGSKRSQLKDMGFST